jgi:hypothetical protein
VATLARSGPVLVPGGDGGLLQRQQRRQLDGWGGEKVELNFWVFEEGGIGSFLETLEKSFETKYPNVDLKITAYPEDNYGSSSTPRSPRARRPTSSWSSAPSRCARVCCRRWMT